MEQGKERLKKEMTPLARCFVLFWWHAVPRPLAAASRLPLKLVERSQLTHSTPLLQTGDWLFLSLSKWRCIFYKNAITLFSNAEWIARSGICQPGFHHYFFIGKYGRVPLQVIISYESPNLFKKGNKCITKGPQKECGNLQFSRTLQRAS